MTSRLKNHTVLSEKKGWEYSSVVECLPCICEALGSRAPKKERRRNSFREISWVCHVKKWQGMSSSHYPFLEDMKDNI
jgi:hypothetical protein